MNDQQPGTTPKNQPAQPSQPNQKKKEPTVDRKPVPVQVKARHDVNFRHDVFRSDNKQCFRNVSYKAFEPNLVKIDHAHVYHSHSNDGRKLTRTGAACGHWHEIRHYIDAKGVIKADCGPPMHEVTFLSQTGRTVNQIEQVSFEREEMTGPHAGKIIKIADDHTHTMEYLGSEDLSQSKIKSGLEAEREQAAAMGVQVGGLKDNTPTPMSAADGASIV